MSNIIEAKLRVIVAAVVLVLTIVALFTINGALAWFAENESTTASNMQVSVKSFPNLIIAKTEEEITSGKLQFEVSFGDLSRGDMIAVTRDEQIQDTYLKFVTNHYAISDITGIAKEGFDLEYKPVPSTDNGQYFVDCTVLLASISSPIATDSLLAKIYPLDNSDPLSDYMHAISIDFYVDEVSLEGYRGTTSLADALKTKNDYIYEGIELFGPEDDEIPLNTEGYITVIMRCYFDGALLDDKGNAYINSYTVLSDQVYIGVDFTVSEAATEE